MQLYGVFEMFCDSRGAICMICTSVFTLCASGVLLYISHSTCVERIYTQNSVQVQTLYCHLKNNCGRKYVQNSSQVFKLKETRTWKKKMRITRGSDLDLILPGLKLIQLTGTRSTNLKSFGFAENTHMKESIFLGHPVLIFKVTLLLLILGYHQ